MCIRDRYEFASWSSRAKSAVRSMLLKWSQAGVARALWGWRLQAEESMRLKAAASRVVARLQNGALAGAFGQWCEYCEARREARRAAESAAQHQARVEQSVRKAVLKMQHASVAEALGAWATAVSTAKRLRSAARRVVARMQQGLLSEAFAGWLEHAVFSVRSKTCLLYTSPSPRDATLSRMPSSA